MHKTSVLLNVLVIIINNNNNNNNNRKYQDLACEMKRCHGASKVSVVPIVVGAFGTTSKSTRTWHRQIELPDVIGSVHLAAILGTAHILRKVLGL